jgi:hypothetical protein
MQALKIIPKARHYVWIPWQTKPNASANPHLSSTAAAAAAAAARATHALPQLHLAAWYYLLLGISEEEGATTDFFKRLVSPANI